MCAQKRTSPWGRDRGRRVLFELRPGPLDLGAQRRARWSRAHEGGAAVRRFPGAPHEAGLIQALDGAAHRGSIGVELGREIRLPLRAGIPQVHG
jgi:hypothetical protein